MIWIGCLVLAALCVLLAVQLLFARRLGRRIDGLSATFEGPARLELFGHVTYVGWVRQGPERIDVLTIEGEALQCDARARYRLTPLSWQRFCEVCVDAADRRAKLQEVSEKWRTAAEERDALHARAGEFQERHANLKEALAKGIDGLTAAILAARRDDRPEDDILDIKAQLQGAFDADDPIPF